MSQSESPIVLSEIPNREMILEFLKNLLSIPPLQVTFANGGLLHPVGYIPAGVKVISHEEIEKIIKVIELNKG